MNPIITNQCPTVIIAALLVLAGGIAAAADNGARAGTEGNDLLRVALLDETADAESRSEAVEVGPEEDALAKPIEPPVIDATDRLVPVVPLADAVTTADNAANTLELLGEIVPPGSYRRLAWSGTELFEGVPVSTPVLVVNG
ncbi:MAG: hypothetical protein WEA08_03555, partial [Woeseia sp.]